MARHISLQFLFRRVCGECFGQEENVGTLFNDLKFPSFNPLTSLPTLGNASFSLSWLLIGHAGTGRTVHGPEGRPLQQRGLRWKLLASFLISALLFSLPYGTLILLGIARYPTEKYSCCLYQWG